MNTKRNYLHDASSRAGEHKKTIEKSGIILMLLILFFLGMMSLDRSNKPENSGKDSASGVIATTSSETKNAVANSDLSDSGIPSEEISTETGSNEQGMGGTTEEIDITKILFPVKEIESTGGDFPEYKKIDEINGNKTYARYIEINPKKSVSFSIGYMEGCPNGCYWGNETCLEACSNPNNWVEDRKFKPEDFIQPLGGKDSEGNDNVRNEGSYTKDRYYGRFTKSNDPSYKTILFYIKIPEDPKEIIGFGYYYVVDSEGKAVRKVNLGIMREEEISTIFLQ